MKQIDKPISIISKCVLPINLNKDQKFDIICRNKGRNECPINPDEEIIIGISDPIDKIYNSKRIFLRNFASKSSIINIVGGTLHKIKYEKENPIDIDISLNIKIRLNNVEKWASCNLEKNTKNIICIVENVESNKVNIVILENPIDNIELIPNKSIVYTNFKDKKLYTIAGGSIEKGKCEGNNYIFYFRNSSSITFKGTFSLQMKYPNAKATCEDASDIETSTRDIKCIIKGISTCPIESEDKDIIVGDIDPEPIQLSETEIIYFSSFIGKNSFVYKISVGILKKGVIDIEKCEYNFEFENKEPFEFDYFNKDIIFNLNINIGQFEVKSICRFYEVNQINDIKKVRMYCSFDMNEEICKSNELNYYDLKIGDDVDGQITSDDEISQNLISKFNFGRI